MSYAHCLMSIFKVIFQELYSGIYELIDGGELVFSLSMSAKMNI